MRPDVQEVKVEQGLEQAMQHYRRFLEETPETPMTPEAMRRLADLQLEKQFGIHTGDAKPREMAAPEPAKALASTPARTSNQRPRLPTARSCGNPIRISSGARQRRAGSRQAPTLARRCRTLQALTQIPKAHSRRSLSISGCSPSTPITRKATRSSIRWRERTTNSAAPKRPWKPWSA